MNNKVINAHLKLASDYYLGGWYESHLFAICLSGESFHHEIQLSELTQSSTDVSVKVFVFLILIIENCFVLFPFLHTADLWILATERRHTVKRILCIFLYVVMFLQYINNTNKYRTNGVIQHVNVNLHDVVCNDVHFGVQVDWILLDLM